MWSKVEVMGQKLIDDDGKPVKVMWKKYRKEEGNDGVDMNQLMQETDVD